MSRIEIVRNDERNYSVVRIDKAKGDRYEKGVLVVRKGDDVETVLGWFNTVEGAARFAVEAGIHGSCIKELVESVREAKEAAVRAAKNVRHGARQEILDV